MYSLPGYIEKKKKRIKNYHRGKNDPIMIRAVVLQKNRLILNSK